MRILILTNHDLGLYKFRKEVLETLLKENEVFVSMPRGIFTDKIIEMGCHYIDTSFERKGKNPFKDLELLNFYKKTIKEVRPDVVLTYTIKPNVYGGLACQQLKVPYIANVTGLGSAIENGGLLQFISLNLYKLGLKKADMVFFQNDANRDFMLEKNAVGKNYDMLPGSGVNLSQYEVSEFPNDETIDFTYVGRLMKEKGFELYMEAAKHITGKYPNTRFHVCGPDEDNYRDLVKELSDKGILVYEGYVDDMKEVYKRIQCTIHPTYYPEGMSNVLLESLACGRPIITTDRPGCKEIVEDGVNGFVVKQNDLNDLIEKIEKYLSLSYEERKQLGLNGRRKVEKEFDRNIVINKYLDAIDKVTKK